MCPPFHGSVKQPYISGMIRLHVEAPLSAGAMIDAAPAQAHYLGTVMRRSAGDPVCLFNGRDGEWAGRIVALARGKASCRPTR